MSNVGCTSYKFAADVGVLVKNAWPFWIAIGHTDAWPDESSPPTPTRGTDDIDTPIVFVRPTIWTMARSVSEADYDAAPAGQKAVVTIGEVQTFFVFVADEDAPDEYARFLYYRGEFNPVQGIPVDQFRQVGVYANLVPAAGYESANWLAPENVDDRGRLAYHDNGEFVNMSASGPVVAVHGAIEF